MSVRELVRVRAATHVPGYDQSHAHILPQTMRAPQILIPPLPCATCEQGLFRSNALPAAGLRACSHDKVLLISLIGVLHALGEQLLLQLHERVRGARAFVAQLR